MLFEEIKLSKPLQKALDDLEYEYATPIQEQAFPIIMSGRNVVGIAQTGTGKTFAYLLPIINMLSFSDQKEPRVLILVPTRELVVQTLEEMRKLTKYTSLRTAGIYGGTNMAPQKQTIYNGLDILVGTPGRLIDLTNTGILRLKYIQKLVIDEVDEMLNLGFRHQMSNLIEMLPKKRQTLMFSATLTEDVEIFINDSIPFPQKIEITPSGTPIDKIEQYAYLVPNFNTKVNLLENLLNTNAELSKVLVFVKSKKMADRLFEQSEKLFPGLVGIIHSNKGQGTRLNAIKQLKEGDHRVLIATDIIARGMDIHDVTHVINFDMPDVPDDYIHRIGRTGRADKEGIAISFVNQVEQEYMANIETLMKKPIQVKELPEGLVISNVYSEEERPTKLYDKNYLKLPSIKNSKGSTQEKKAKNMKVNLGGPKARAERFEKSGKPIPLKRRKIKFS